MSTLDTYLSEQLHMLETKHLKRELSVTSRRAMAEVEHGGDRLISFSDNDYLGLADHPKVVQAAQDALSVGAVGAKASRLITGNHPHYVQLEQRLAEYKKTDAACVFGSGYLANIGVLTSLLGKEDLIIADKFSHACMIDGAQLSGAALKRFAHNNMTHLAALLAKHRASYRHCLIMTETVFSMDGDRAPIDAIDVLAKQYDAWVMSDDAHGLGLVNSPAVDIQMGTLSKAAGVYGGYVCGSHTLINTLKTTARPLIYSTALPSCVVAAAEQSIQIMAQEPERAERAMQNAALFCERLGLPAPQSAIVPLVVGAAEDAVAASLALKKHGFLVSAIRPPTVPVGSARLRFTFSANHDTSDIERMTECITNAKWFINSNA